MADYTFHKLQDGDFDKLIPIVKDCFGVDVNLDYFRWKFLENPAGLMHGFYALSAEGEVAAYYGVIPEWYIVDGEERLIYQSGDTMTHSRHRRKGLFYDLAKHCYSTLEMDTNLLITGFPGPKSTPGLEKLGWHHLFKVRHFLYPAQLTKLRLSRKDEGAEIISNPEVLCEVGRRSVVSNIRVNKKRDQFLWRVSNPRYKYQYMGYKDKDSADYTGYAVFYFHQNKIMILDFYADTDKGHKRIINKLKNIMQQNKLRGIVHFCQENSTYAKILRKNSFYTNPFKFGPTSFRVPFMLYCSDKTLCKYRDSKLWNLNSYDHDSH